MVVKNIFTSPYDMETVSKNGNMHMNQFAYLSKVGASKFSIKATDIKFDITQNIYNWDKEYLISDLESVDSWTTPKGKYVILVEPDEPWYVKKEQTTEPIRLIDKPVLKNLDYRDNADYKPEFVMDKTKQHLGYGYSYRDRLLGHDCDGCNKDEKVFEMFEANKLRNYTNLIAFVMIIILLMYLFINY